MPVDRAMMMVPLQGTLEAPRRAREAVRVQLGDAIAPGPLYDLLLVVSELVGAAVTHAGHDPGSTVHLRLDLAGGRVRVEVSDPVSRSAARDPRAGAALGIVEALGARCGTCRGSRMGTATWAEMSTLPAPHHAPAAV